MKKRGRKDVEREMRQEEKLGEGRQGWRSETAGGRGKKAE